MYKNKFVFAVSFILCLLFTSVCFAVEPSKLGTVKYGTHRVLTLKDYKYEVPIDVQGFTFEGHRGIYPSYAWAYGLPHPTCIRRPEPKDILTSGIAAFKNSSNEILCVQYDVRRRGNNACFGDGHSQVEISINDNALYSVSLKGKASLYALTSSDKVIVFGKNKEGKYVVFWNSDGLQASTKEKGYDYNGIRIEEDALIVSYSERDKEFESNELRLKWKDWLECFEIVK